jgi:hypothetical protein
MLKRVSQGTFNTNKQTFRTKHHQMSAAAPNREALLKTAKCAGYLEKKGDVGPEFLRTCKLFVFPLIRFFDHHHSIAHHVRTTMNASKQQQHREETMVCAERNESLLLRIGERCDAKRCHRLDAGEIDRGGRFRRADGVSNQRAAARVLSASARRERAHRLARLSERNNGHRSLLLSLGSFCSLLISL